MILVLLSALMDHGQAAAYLWSKSLYADDIYDTSNNLSIRLWDNLQLPCS